MAAARWLSREYDADSERREYLRPLNMAPLGTTASNPHI
jgi:hypothetical protein